MKNLALILLVSVLTSCSSLLSDPLMVELKQSEQIDQHRMRVLGLSADKGHNLELIDPADRLLLQKDFDCGSAKEKIAYCRY